jgi:hypothetical protein
MTPAEEQKLAEQIFNGSLALLAVLIAVAGIVAASYEKVSGIPDIEPHFRYYLWSVAALSILSCIVGWLALNRLAGGGAPMWLILYTVRVVMTGVALASVGLVLITVL